MSNSDGPLNWIVGAFYNRAETYGTSKEFVPGFPEFEGVVRPDNLEYLSIADVDFKETAFFGEIGYDFSDRWSATVGARHFKFSDDSTVGFDLPFLYTLLGIYGPDEINPSLENASVSDRDTIFKFNTSFKFTDDLLGYLTVSEGYRTGGSNAIPACPDPIPPGQNVCALPNELLILPDKTLNREIGLKSAWLDGRLVVNGALYYITWKDIQIGGTTVNGNLPITVNAGQAESRGVELSAVARLSPGLRLNASYSYTDAKLTEDASGIVGGQDAFDGDRLPGSPKQQANLALNYYFPMANGMAWGADYSVHVQSDVYTRAGLRNNGEVLPGYSTHNLAWTLFGERWDMRLYARNLFNKYAETGVRATPAFIRDVNGFALRSYYKSMIEPRKIGVDFTYRF